MSELLMKPLGDLLTARTPDVAVQPDLTLIPAGIFSFGRGIFLRPPISGSETKYSKLTALRHGDFVYSKLKAWEGAFGIAKEAHAGAVVSSEFPVFDVDLDSVDSSYLSYLVRTDGFIDSVRRLASGLGARRDRVHPDSILKILVPLPSLPEQRRIASWLSDVVDRSSNLIRSADHAQLLSNALLESAFNETAKNSRPLALGDILNQREPDFSVEPTSEVAQAGVYSFGRGLFRRPVITGADTSYRSMTTIHNGDFMYSKLMAWEGAIAMASSSEAGLLATPEFPVFEVDSSQVVPGYLHVFIRTRAFGERLRTLSTGTNVRRRRVHPSEMLQIEIPLPSEEVQENIAAVGSALRMREAHHEVVESRVAALLPAALNKVFGSLN